MYARLGTPSLALAVGLAVGCPSGRSGVSDPVASTEAPPEAPAVALSDLRGVGLDTETAYGLWLRYRISLTPHII